MFASTSFFFFFFFNDTATTEIYTLSLHDALPISHAGLIHDRHHDDGNARGACIILQLQQNLPPGRLHQYFQGDCVGLALRHDLHGAARLITQHHLVAGSGKMRLDKLSCHGVILNDKNPRCLLRLSPERAFLWGHWWNSGSYRQTKMEAASLAGLTIHGQATSLQLQEASRYRQTQAHAFGGLSRFPQLVEDLEDALLFLGRNPRPGTTAHLRGLLPAEIGRAHV